MRRRSLSWGPELVGRLLPHRRPFAMVDTIDAFAIEPTPTLSARRAISHNEPVFDGHFPELPLWPGVYTIEALAQATNLLLVLVGLAQSHPEGVPGVSDELSRMSRALKLQPVRGGAQDLAEALERLKSATRFGVLTHADVKLKHPVFAGDTLGLHVRLLDETQGMLRVAVEATVGPQEVASGRLTVAPRDVPTGVFDR